VKVCTVMNISCIEHVVIEPKLVDLIGRETVDTNPELTVEH